MNQTPTDPDKFIEEEVRPRREEFELLAQLEDNPLADRAVRILDMLDRLDEEEA